MTDTVVVKPQWRGWIHQIAFFASIPAGVMLVALAQGTTALVGAIVFAVSLTLLYGTSALYHRGRWSARGRAVMQRLDHSMIYVLIAGTATPVMLLALRPAWGISLLVIAWTCAAIGVTLTAVRMGLMHRINGVVYVVMGWLVVIALPQLVHELSVVQLGLMFVGGVLYTAGVVLLGLRRPDPRPAVFGYHEVWHAMTVGAGACHYGLVLLLVRA